MAPSGKVYAVDIQQDLLDYINQRDKAENIRNVQTVLGEFDDPKLPGREEILKWMSDAGFKLVEEHPDLFPGTKWFLVFGRK